jgi:hypothetical protein
MHTVPFIFLKGNKAMMIEILQELWNAIRDQNEEQIDISLKALEYYGLSRETAQEMLEAGKNYFGRDDPVKEKESES